VNAVNAPAAARDLLPVALIAAWYAVGLVRMWERVGTGRLVPRSRAVAFGAGVATLAVALGPPLDTLSEQHLAAHMVQHVLLIYVCAPLLVAGAPLPTMLWAFSDPVRARCSRVWRRAHRHVAGDAWPLWVAGTLTVQAVVLLVWHVPPLYDAAVRNPGVHVLEHAAFLFTAIAFWWAAAGAVRRARYGGVLVAIFIAKLPGLLLGVGMTLDRHLWYPVYGRGERALSDQQYAGVVMWVFGGTLAALWALWMFALWMRGLERHSPNGELLPPDLRGARSGA
jgi:putative membrane protein